MTFTEQQIHALKQKHGDIFLIKTESGETCLLRRPSRQDLSYISAVKDPMKMSELMLETLWLDGDEAIKTDEGRSDPFYLGIAPTCPCGSHLEEVIKVKEATIKKL